MATGFDYFGVFTGAASLYGAFVSWQQRRGAAREHRSAANAAARAERLVRILNCQRAFADCIHRCQSAQMVLSQTPPRAADLLIEVAGLVGRLSGDPESRGRPTPANWRAVQQDLHDLVVGIRELGARAMPNAATAKAAGIIVRIISEMERVSAELSTGEGVR